LLLPSHLRTGRRGEAFVLASLGLRFLVVGLVAYRVPAAVFLHVDVAGRLHAPPQLLACGVVAWLRRADEVAIGKRKYARHLAEAGRVAIRELARAQALLDRGLLHLQAVLVSAGQEQHRLAVAALETRDGIGCDRLVGVAD